MAPESPAADEPECRFPGGSILTGRLLLRPLSADDAPELARQANDRELAAMTAAVPHPYGLADAEAFIASVRAHDAFVRAVACGRTDRFFGVCSLSDCREDRSTELGYWIGREHWGRGYATEAAQAMIDEAFARNAGIASVTASCRVINGASRRVIEKCGFQMRRLGFVTSRVDGRVSAECYDLDRRAWEALKRWGKAS